jgi:hypothetical protein
MVPMMMMQARWWSSRRLHSQAPTPRVMSLSVVSPVPTTFCRRNVHPQPRRRLLLLLLLARRARRRRRETLRLITDRRGQRTQWVAPQCIDGCANDPALLRLLLHAHHEQGARAARPLFKCWGLS